MDTFLLLLIICLVLGFFVTGLVWLCFWAVGILETPLFIQNLLQLGRTRRPTFAAHLFPRVVLTTIALPIIVAFLVAGLRIVPVYVSAFEFKGEMRKQAMRNPTALMGFGSSPDAIREDLLRMARELGLTIEADAIQVTQTASGVQINVHYSVPVDLIVFNTSIAFDETVGQ